MAILTFRRPDKIILKKQNEFDGTFEFRPLEPGYGLTIGNALRRVLLSGLNGYAISSIKIEGVNHAFDTISGITEDVTEIILQLKQIRFKLKEGIESTPQNERIKVSLKGTKIFQASDIGKQSNFFDIINHELHICTMDDKVAKLDMELTVSKGRGYVASENNKKEEMLLGEIAIDSIYTPIVRVKYAIENYRVDDRTDFEKLILDVKTDGSIKPEKAVKEASDILIQHFFTISDEEKFTQQTKEEKIETKVNDEGELHIKKILKTPLEDLDLSVRAFNCLKGAKINSLSELVRYEQEQLLKFRNFGQKSLNEIEQMLREKGLHFGMDLAKYGIEAEVSEEY